MADFILSTGDIATPAFGPAIVAIRPDPLVLIVC